MQRLTKDKVQALLMTKQSHFVEKNSKLIEELSVLEEGEGVFMSNDEWGSAERPNAKQLTVSVHDATNTIMVFGVRRIKDSGWVIHRRREIELKKKDNLAD